MTSTPSMFDLEAPPDVLASPPATRPCVRYEAATPWGTWRLRIAFDLAAGDRRDALHGAAAAARVLLRAEDLLVALDTWCVEAGLDTLPWTWSAAEDSAPGRSEAGPAPAEANERRARGGSNRGDVSDHGRAARARWLGDALDDDVGVTLGAPWAALRRLGAPTPRLQNALRWDDAWAVCVLDRFALDADDEARLEPAGAVLIASSLRSPWRGALRARGEADDAGLVLDLAAAEGGVAIVATPVDGAVAAAVASGADSVVPNWEIRSLHPIRVPVAVLCGWSQSEAPWPRALFTELELARFSARSPVPSPVEGAARPYMPGRLMPWGRGVAMLLAPG